VSSRLGVCHGFLDNGAFGDWRAGRPFDAVTFARDLDRVAGAVVPPDFIVVPDKVAGGEESLGLSLSWRGAVARVGPAFLVVQDGMTEPLVAEALAAGFAGIFVGGTLPWKLRTGAAWVQLAQRRGLPCHIGRVGTPKRVAWARRIGATSIDSCLPLWSRENLQRFVAAVHGRQLELV
jgi:hypothetical protein